jgi:hypothetical protein
MIAQLKLHGVRGQIVLIHQVGDRVFDDVITKHRHRYNQRNQAGVIGLVLTVFR